MQLILKNYLLQFMNSWYQEIVSLQKLLKSSYFNKKYNKITSRQRQKYRI